MKFSTLALAAAVSSASAQFLSGQPSCAVPCLSTAISSAGCQETDIACQCGSGQAAIASIVAPCLISACDASDLNTAESVGLGQCSAYSASLTASTSSPATVSSPSPSSAPTPTTATSTTSVTAVTTSVPPSTSAASTSTPASSSSTAKTSAPTPVSSSGAAPGLVADIGGAMGILAFIAAL
jgi:hypothetical protein